jgi:hypothetical protein
MNGVSTSRYSSQPPNTPTAITATMVSGAPVSMLLRTSSGRSAMNTGLCTR